MDTSNVPHILCTGGAGYIGSHIIIKIAEMGWNFSIFDNFSNGSKSVIDKLEQILKKKVTYKEVDLCNRESLLKSFKEIKPDLVIHCAGLKSVNDSVYQPLSYYHNNVTGTINLLTVMKELNCTKIIFSSSATVYSSKSEPLVETDPIAASNPYGNTKLIIEEILKDLANSTPSWKVYILRYFNPVGAHQSGLIGDSPAHPTNLLPVIAQVASGKIKCLPIYGSDWDTEDGTGVRDYIHIEDLSEGHVAAANKLLSENSDESFFAINNLGTGKGVSVLEMINQFKKASGLSIPYQFTDRRKGDLGSVIADPSLANKELNWKASRSISEACESFWNWIKF